MIKFSRERERERERVADTMFEPKRTVGLNQENKRGKWQAYSRVTWKLRLSESWRSESGAK